MEQNQEKQEIVAVEDSNKRLLFLNQTYFVYSVMTIVKLIQSTSVSALENKKVPDNKIAAHQKLATTCNDIINEYQSSSALDDSSVDHIKIIKKAFYVLKDNLELIKNKDPTLFTVRNQEGKITTIIPGLNINLVYEYLTDEDKNNLWNHIYTLFVSTVNMVYANTSSNRHKQSVLDMVDYCKKETAKSTNLLKLYPKNGAIPRLVV